MLAVTYILDGLKVIDAATHIAAPAAGTILSDFGADVIKVEAPHGDGCRLLRGKSVAEDYCWLLTSRNKRSICLDLKKAAGRELLNQLVASADVFLTNFREHQIRRFEMDYEALRKANPRLIYAHVSSYGRKGPDGNQLDSDMASWWARTGILDAVSSLGKEAISAAEGIGDHVTALGLLSAVMMALYQREKTGEGGFVSTSLVASGCYANSLALQSAIAVNNSDVAFQEEMGLSRSSMKCYRTRDDKSVILVIINLVQEWSRIAKALGHKEWLKDPEFQDIAGSQKCRDKILSRISLAISELNLKDLCLMLDQHGLVYSAVEKPGDVIRDAHLIENEIFVRTKSDFPEYEWTVNNPINIRGFKKKQPAEAPESGEHSEQVLKEMGLTDSKIRDLIKAGVVLKSN